MKIKIEGFVVAQQYHWEQTPTFTWFAHEPTNELVDLGYVVVTPHTIITEVPDDFDMSLAKIHALHAQKAALKSKFVADLDRIDNDIQNLLALPNATKEQL